tara:strand:+ start:2280 stop:2714 length:435 start_codon:yes stop_codon:yes gene_type:complete
MSKKLFISKSLNIPEDKLLLVGDFCNYCAASLPINGNFEIHIVGNRDLHNIKTTAHYNTGRGIIKVYGKNRALVDILRSVAHELTHMMQDENNMLNGVIQDAGGPIEDEANARAGELIKLYAKSHPIRKRIYEAAIKKKTVKLG